MNFRIKLEWDVTQDSDVLVIHGGADETFELQLDEQITIFSSIQHKPYLVEDLSPSDSQVHEQLLSAGIVTPEGEEITSLSIQLIGDSIPTPQDFAPDGLNFNHDEEPDIQIVARTQSALEELLKAIDYETITTPHIFLDLAYHSVVSIGPLVFPAKTACVACLEGRVRQRWGDPQPPPEPKATKHLTHFAWGTLFAELNRYKDADYRLIGKTINWNADSWECSVNHLYKVVYCPVCHSTSTDSDGMLQ